MHEAQRRRALLRRIYPYVDEVVGEEMLMAELEREVADAAGRLPTRRGRRRVALANGGSGGPTTVRQWAS